jgi:hypothetical protein
MLGLESNVMARDRQGSSNVACAAASLRPVPPGGRADHRSHRGHPRIGLPGPSSADGQRRRAHDQQRSGPEPGTTMAVPSWRRGRAAPGCRAAACPATSRHARGAGEIAWSTGQTWRVSAHAPGRHDADRMSGQGTVVEDAPAVASSGRRPHPDLLRQTHCRGVRWPRGHAAPARPWSPAWWVGRSLATSKGGEAR